MTLPVKKGFLIDAKTVKAEFNEAIIRGTLYATDGEFAGDCLRTTDNR